MIKRMDYVLIPMGPTSVAAIWDIVVMESTALVSNQDVQEQLSLCNKASYHTINLALFTYNFQAIHVAYYICVTVSL